MKKLMLYFTFLLLFILCSTSCLADAKTIAIGYIEFPPMTYTNQHGNPSGAIIDITTKTLKKAGFGWTAVSLPTRRMAKMLVNGDIQLWIGLATLPEFKNNTYVGKSVVKKLFLRAYTIGQNKPIYTPEDLKGKTILILRGYSYGGWVNFIKDPLNQINFIEFNSHQEAFKGLALFSKKNQKSCYLLGYKHPSQIVLNAKTIPDITFNNISSLDIHFVVTRNMKNAQRVLEQIETAFNQLKDQGVLQ